MARLKKEHKELIVKELACYSSSSEVKKLMKERYGLDISSSQIAFYDPTTNSSGDLAIKWVELHRHTRNEYKDEIIRHDIAGKGYRLGFLQKMFEQQYQRKNFVHAADLLKQAAQEVGGVFESGELPAPEKSGSTFIQEIYQKIERANIQYQLKNGNDDQ